MKLIFEKGNPGRKLSLFPASDVPAAEFTTPRRTSKPRLPEVSETELDRHYTELAKRTFGMNDGFYPLGSCTMKYNPKVNEMAAQLDGFTDIHPLQPAITVQGALEIMKRTSDMLCEITGMDAFSLQPAAGAHGEFTGMLLIKAYHKSRGDLARNKIIVPDSAHGTNPASAAMAGFTVVNVESGPDGCVDLDKLRAAAGPDTAGLMLTNPNTVGLFDKNILEITRIIHEAGGLCYYDGANLNAVMGIARPGDMGFDVCHLNLHKSFSTPHGGGGPGSGPCGCKEFLKKFLPGVQVEEATGAPVPEAGTGEKAVLPAGAPVHGMLRMTYPGGSIGSVRSFYANFLVVVRAFTFLRMIGREGVPEVAKNAVLNANYMRVKLADEYPMAFDHTCMHEFVMDLSELKKKTGVSALDVAKTLLDFGIHPPTMYFPLIVHEALMVEPTETETKETLDQVISDFRQICEKIRTDPESLHAMPEKTPVGRLDEVGAARHPVVRYDFK